MGQKSIVTNPETVEALQEVYRAKGGLMKPLDVVEAARPETSPLHKHFEWDDSVAAERFRIEQARTLLQKVYVRIENPDGKGRMAQVFVSLSTDREQSGGYRAMVDVLSDADMKNQLIRDALVDMQIFEDRYKTLRELSSVFTVMRENRATLEKTA